MPPYKADDALDVFRHLDELALAVSGRGAKWTDPVRLTKVTNRLLEDAPPAARVALAALLGRGAKTSNLPRWLSKKVQSFITEFDHVYSLARRESNLYATSLTIGMQGRWNVLVKSLQDAGVERAAVEQLDRYVSIRTNFLLASGGDLMDDAAATLGKALPTETIGRNVGALEPALGGANLRKAVLPALEASASAIAKAERRMVELVEEYAVKELGGKRLSAAARARIPWSELKPFNKLQRLLPPGDPAWRELAAFVASQKNVTANMLQGAIGEIVAMRTPGVVDFLRRETGRVLASDPTLAAQGWRVLVQHRPVQMATAKSSLKKGKTAIPGEGLEGNAASFDVSVWLVKEGENPTAMPVVRVQVKSGKEGNVLDGVKQSLVTDEWRQYSDSVTLDFGSVGAPKPRNFELKPPDTFSVVRVLVGADVPSAKALRAEMPSGTDLNVFKMPLTGAEFGMIGGILSRNVGG